MCAAAPARYLPHGMTDTLDWYKVLRVDPAATTEQIHAAYRALARTFHPDVSGQEEPMKLLNQAWDALRQPSRRMQYDRERAGGGRTESVVAAASPADTSGSPRPRPREAAAVVMDYGRYQGWSLGQIAAVDRGFLEWFRSVPGGRWLKAEIDEVLATLDSAPTRRAGGHRGAEVHARQR
jgi:curved DNA-binding protein CbpA